METKQKLLILYCTFLMSILSSCATVHETSSIQPKMSVTDATNSIKEVIKDITSGDIGTPVVTDVSISEEGFTLFHDDKTKKYYTFNDIEDPRAVLDETFDDIVYLNQIDQHSFIHFNNSKSAIMFADALYSLKHDDRKEERARSYEDCQRHSRQISIDLILSGVTADGLNLQCMWVPKSQLESILNENLIEWKSNELGERLQKSSSGQLRDLVVQIEKGILRLDSKVHELKDAADEDARQVQAPGAAAPVKQAPVALKMSHLLDQRKTILMVILGTVKRASNGL
jgi:hypothetical protein